MRDLPQPLLEHQHIVEQFLRKHLEIVGAGGLPLYRMMQYQLGWVDRDGLEEQTAPPARLLGALCMEAASSMMTESASDAASLEAGGLVAAAFELLQQSMAVHEDMQIAEPHTEGRAAVWWIWGPAQAINVGDGLHALARLAAFRLRELGLPGEQVLAVAEGLDDAALQYYEGQYLELTYQERVDITEAQYVNMASAKRGALFGGALGVGAMAAGADRRSAELLRSFGSTLGLASQVWEDVDLIWGNRGEGRGRILNKSKLYPVVHALETGPIPRKRALGAIYFKRVMEPADAEELRRILDEAGSREHAQTFATSHMNAALAMLAEAGIASGTVERWRAIAEALVLGEEASG
ncbi:MAG: polyprenyl synthetase family protein [Dehalococcoidia bacterium]